MIPLAGGLLCLNLLGGGTLCFRSEHVSGDTAPMEHPVTVVCSDALGTEMGVPKCNARPLKEETR